MESSPRRSNPTIDRISALPDSILCHILSFLPSKHASSTSILSKRWKFVWLSVLTLHFDDKTFKDFKTFREFVYTTMFKLRDKRTSIHSFTFKLGDSSRFNQKELNRIFKFVNKRGVQYLDFHMLDKKHRIKLPQCVINFKTLQVLKLTHLTMRDFDHMELSMLKTLHLAAVYFKSPQDFAKFLFGCPVLQELHTDIIIFTDSMKSPVPLENFNALPNLVKATIIHDFYYYTPMAMNLVCKTKILHVEKMWMSLTELPMFHNLTHMELSVHDRERDYCYGNCTQLLEILPHFPKLQYFIIQNCGTEKNTCYDCWKHPVTTPECISSQLKTCCIRGYNGTVYELKFAKYIMEHSKVLETMIVKSTTGLLKGQNLLEFFFSYTRVSKRCKLLYD